MRVGSQGYSELGSNRCSVTDPTAWIFCVISVPEIEYTFFFKSSCAFMQCRDAKEKPNVLPFPGTWGRSCRLQAS